MPELAKASKRFASDGSSKIGTGGGGKNFGSDLSSDEGSPAFRLGNLGPLAGAGKWRGHALAGMVVYRSALLHPGVELRRLLDLKAIFPATIAELNRYEQQYGEAPQIVIQRKEQIDALRRSLSKRVSQCKADSTRVELLIKLIGEWSAIEGRCRIRWHGEFGSLVGKTEEEVKRHYLDRETDLRTWGQQEDVYRDIMAKVAEPVLITGAGLPVDIAPLHDFLQSTKCQFGSRNPGEWDVLNWLPTLRYKLLHSEGQSKRWYRSAAEWVGGNLTKIIVAVLGPVIVLLVVYYLKSHGVNLK